MLGPVLLGVAIATKIYPAVLLPLLVARTWRREGRRAALTALALSVGTSLLIYLPFAILAPEGVARSVWRQLGRPLQIESLGSGVLLALHHAARHAARLGVGVGLAEPDRDRCRGRLGRDDDRRRWRRSLLVWVRYARAATPTSDARFVRYAAAAVVAFVAFGKVAVAPVPDLAARDRGARPGRRGHRRDHAARSSRARSRGSGSRATTGTS